MRHVTKQMGPTIRQTAVRQTALAFSFALLTLSASAGIANAQATGPGSGPGSGAPASTGGGTASPGVNAPATGAQTGAGTTTTGQPAGSGATGSGAGSPPGMAAQDASVGSDAASGTNGANTGGNGSVPGTSKAPDSPNFDLARTVQSALSSSAALIESQRNVEIDSRRAKEAADQSKPMLTAEGSATRFDQATQVAIGPQKFTVIGDHTEALSLNATERIDFFGLIRAQTSQLRLQSLADTFTTATIQDERVLQAQTIYFSLLRAIHQVRVSEASLRNAEEQQSVARRLFEGQIGQKIDLLRANTQAATAQQNLIAARNNREVARASFNDLVGRPLSAPVFIQDVPGVNVGVDILTGVVGGPGATPPTVNTPTVGAPIVGTPTVTPGTPPATPNADAGSPPAGGGFVPFPAPTNAMGAIDVDQAITTAQAMRPEVLQQATLVRATNVGVQIARSGLQPAFSISAAGNYYPTTSFQTPRQRTVAVTVALSIPLYDGGLTRDRIAEARERTKNAETALDSTKEGVALEVRQTYLNLSTAARQIDAANTALQQAIAARQLAQVRYEGQVGIYLEVTDAQSALVQAENAQVDAVYNYLISRAQFENAVGTPRIFISATPPTPGTPAVPLGTPTTTPTATPPVDTNPVTPPAATPPATTPPTAIGNTHS